MASNEQLPVFDRFFEARLAPNEPSHRGPVCISEPPDNPLYRLAILEFDDQGLCFDPSAMDAFKRLLAELEDKNPIILVFVHGWKHNAGAADDNLQSFRALLAQTAQANGTAGGSARPLLGVYVAWRGLSRDGNFFWMQSSFWDRQEAAARVSAGSVRELLGRLRSLRRAGPDHQGPSRATLVIVGHSFGGAIVFAALSQSLIEAAATEDKIVPSFADLVLLVNPAFSAVSYLPIHNLVRRRAVNPAQIPVCVSVTALNDWATGYAYPIGNWHRLLSEATRDEHERSSLIRTMGHLPWMRTHEISEALASNADLLEAHTHESIRELSNPGKTSTFGKALVKSLANGSPTSPFWVASATPAVIDGHNGIFKPVFIDFVRSLVIAHLNSPPVG